MYFVLGSAGVMRDEPLKANLSAVESVNIGAVEPEDREHWTTLPVEDLDKIAETSGSWKDKHATKKSAAERGEFYYNMRTGEDTPTSPEFLRTKKRMLQKEPGYFIIY